MELAADSVIVKKIDPNKTVNVDQNYNIPRNAKLMCVCVQENESPEIKSITRKEKLSFTAGEKGAILYLFVVYKPERVYPNHVPKKDKVYHIGEGAGEKTPDNAQGFVARLLLESQSFIGAFGVGNKVNIPISPSDLDWITKVYSTGDPEKAASITYIQENVRIHFIKDNANIFETWFILSKDTEDTKTMFDDTHDQYILATAKFGSDKYYFDVGDPKRDAEVEITEE